MATLQFVATILIVLLSEISAQTPSSSSPPACSNSNLQLTPSLRQKILDEMNQMRQMVKNGQMQLYNGQYALPAEEMPELTWSCEKEEEMHQFLQGECDAYPFGYYPTPAPGISWNHFAADMTDNDAFLDQGFSWSGKFGIHTSLNFAHNTYALNSPSPLDIYHDNAETVGCAIFKCNVQGKPHGWANEFKTHISCSVDPKVQFGEQLYQVSSSVTNYIPPTQDLICPFVLPTPNNPGIFNIELRQMIMTKINEIRSKISSGTYQLENSLYAVQASNLNNLAWSCNDEAAIAATLSTLSCDNILYDPATEFQKIVQPTTQFVYPDDVKGFVNQLINEYFVSNSNFNFLSTSSTYSSQYPAAFALSDQATSFACSVKLCFQNIPGTPPNYHFICRAKPATSINTLLYQV